MIAWIVAALGAPAFEVDTPARLAVACEGARTPLEVGLPWRLANRLLPTLELERSLVHRVCVRSAEAMVCGGRVITVNPSVQLRDRVGRGVEAVVATRLMSGPILSVTRADAPAPPEGAWRVSRRDLVTLYGAWDLGSLPAGAASPSSSGCR